MPNISVNFPFLRVSSPFDSWDWGLTPVRATASYTYEWLVAATIFFLHGIILWPLFIITHLHVFQLEPASL